MLSKNDLWNQYRPLKLQFVTRFEIQMPIFLIYFVKRWKIFIYPISLNSSHISNEYRIGALKCNYSRITIVSSKQMTNTTKHLS